MRSGGERKEGYRQLLREATQLKETLRLERSRNADAERERESVCVGFIISGLIALN